MMYNMWDLSAGVKEWLLKKWMLKVKHEGSIGKKI